MCVAFLRSIGPSRHALDHFLFCRKLGGHNFFQLLQQHLLQVDCCVAVNLWLTKLSEGSVKRKIGAWIKVNCRRSENNVFQSGWVGLYYDLCL